jgi:DNA-binding NtrC family response regulator
MGQGQTVLIVSKFEDGRLTLQEILRSAGYTCLLAGDAGEGLELFRGSRPTLVVSDLRMPGATMNGIDLLKQIRLEGPDTEVILLTSDFDARTVSEGLMLGAFDVLAKPVHVQDLLAAVSRALTRALIVRQARRSG